MKKHWKKTFGRILLLTICCCTLLAGSAFATTDGGAVVTASALNLRSEPNTGSAITTVAYRNQPVIVQERRADNWYKVIYNGTEGYMSADYLNHADTLNSAELGTGMIKGYGVRLRAGASLDSQILGHYSTGTNLKILGVSGAWYCVELNGINGYVYSDYVTLNKQTTAAPIIRNDGQKFVDTAMQYIGVPYVWAGTSPYGFDCSGLVYYCCKLNGYNINRTAASIYYNGVYVDRQNLQPGDAICFWNGSYTEIGHVGFYIGDGKFIHASSGAGYVTINSLSENYYNSHYYGARRIAN